MVRMVARLRFVLSGLLVACSCEGNGLRTLTIYDAGDTGGTGGSQSAACVPGASVACACPAGHQGTQTCTSSNTFAACVCSAPTADAGGDGGATSPPDASAAVGGSGGPAGTGAGGSGGPAGGGGTGGQPATATSAEPGGCVPGVSVACACATGQQGAQTCTSVGTFAACLCVEPTADAGSGPRPISPAALGAQYKFDPNDVPGWQLDPSDSQAFQILAEGTPADLFSFMDGGADLYTDSGCTVSLYESLVSSNQELAVIWAMYFGTDAKTTAMFNTRKSTAGVSLPIPNYNASDAIGKSALTVHTVYAHIGAMYYEMQMSGFTDATSAFQAASQILDVFRSKTR